LRTAWVDPSDKTDPFASNLSEVTMEKRLAPLCSKCTIDTKICRTASGRGPNFCPTLTREALVKRANQEYEKPEIREFARQASIQEGECYANRGVDPYILHPVRPRIQETCEFARKMGFKKIGIAFCSGLQYESAILTRILEIQGFEVVSVVCKAGRTPKELIGIKDEEKINIGRFESMCSPIAQAMILNEEKTDFNILLGLCVGHDSLFLKYADAYSTVLVVKDRVLGHNPAASLYTAGSYYARLKREGF
jgi:uncharacterized metal-binding protein